jgi:DNA-binding beta-propeller fold protein YncE
MSRLGRVGTVVVMSFVGVVVIGLLGTVGLLVALSHLHFDFNLGPVTVPAPSSGGMNLALSPDRSTAYVTEPSSDSLAVLRLGVVVATVKVGPVPTGLAVTPDGGQIWVADSDVAGIDEPGSVSVVSARTDSLVATITVGPNPIDVAFSPDGRRAYVTDYSPLSESPGPSVSVIDTATLAVVGELSPPGVGAPAPSSWNPTSVTVSPDGTKVWVSEADLSASSTSHDSVYVFSAATDAELARISVGAGPFFMTLSRDGRFGYVADKTSCDLKEIDTTSYQVVASVPWASSQGCPFGLASGPRDNVVYTVTGSDHTINEESPGMAFGSVDFASAHPVVTENVGKDPVTVTVAPDGSTAYVVDADRPVVDVVDPATGAVRSVVMLDAPAPAPAPATTAPA